jgi:hypothetical protein
MSRWVIAPSGLIEPVPAPEIYVEDIAAIELIGGCVRLYLASEQLPLEAADAVQQHILGAKMVVPIMRVPMIIGELAKCLGPILAETELPARPGHPRLVRS